MALPKIQHPLFELTIPSTKQKIKFRPFLVKEEKVLLLAQESNNVEGMVNAIKQIISNCVVEDIKIDKELRNVSRYKRINKSSARYIAKTIPTNPVANISNKIFKTMGTVKSAVKGVLKIAPYALVGEIMKPKPAGQGSDLGKPIPKKYR